MRKPRAEAHSLVDGTHRPHRPALPVSALDGWIDVCLVGTWRDMGGREVVLDEARFGRIVEAHAPPRPSSSATRKRMRRPTPGSTVVRLPPARRSGSVAGVTEACVCYASGLNWLRVG